MIPTKTCQLLDMIIDFHNMTVELAKEKRIQIKNMIDKILITNRIKIQNLTECIGTLVAPCPGISYGYYPKSLEARAKLRWWQSQILTKKNKIRSHSFDVEIFFDASGTC